MKKQAKKLMLAKETLQNLNLELGSAVGGATVLCTTDPYRFCPREPTNYTDAGGC